MEIKANLLKIKSELLEKVKLVAVSKTKPATMILDVYNLGHRVFGENKVQELLDKYEKLPKDIEWHFIGHLQTNKVKFIAPFISLIHGVDSLKLLHEINKKAAENNRVIDCLLQIYIAKEESKFGLDENEVLELLNSEEFKKFENIRIIGLMGMATYTVEDIVVFNEFNELAIMFEKIKFLFFSDKEYFKEISMGMSGDYKLAIKAGSTMVRIGSGIFGNRNY